mmetsp:Transcript_4452/g.9673  ORF Transcript_4452/g.9673 Transcript_4452/m.9673 type:complete len:113 (-) Transcript_4452:65-403(-)
MIPRMRSRREKKRRVLDGPIVNVSPIRNRTSPSANRAGSKKNSTPKKRHATPPANKPVPILALSLIIFVGYCVSYTVQSKLLGFHEVTIVTNTCNTVRWYYFDNGVGNVYTL